jgi:RNA-directed DNA polymerase
MSKQSYYYIKSRPYNEMLWWKSHGKSPFVNFIEFKPITKWSKFRLNKDFDKKIDDIYAIHQIIKDLPEYRFYNSSTKEYYIRNTPTNTFRLRKRKGGYREITVFSEEYKQMHSMLMEIYQDLFPAFPESTSAYIKGKSQLDTVKKHKDAKVHLSLDLAEFYPSIKTENLASVLKSLAIVVANMTEISIDRLAEISTFGGSLAQGSSISPILSNIFSLPLDYELYEYVKNTNITYTRYADDISLSSPNIIALPRKKELEPFVNRFQERLDRLYGGDLKINKSKTKLQFEGQIKVLGICINHDESGEAHLSVGKSRKQEYGRELFQLLCEIADDQVDDKLIDYQTVRGKIEYLKQFEPIWFEKQQSKLRVTFNFTGDVWRYILSRITIPETENE